MEARKITVNLQPNSGMAQRISLSQYDVGVPMQITLTDGAVSASLPSGCTAKIHGTRPSGVGFSQSCTISGNVVSVNSTTDMTGEYGHFPAEIVLESSGKVIGSANFIMNIEKSPHPDGTIDSDIIRQASVEDRLEALEGSELTFTDPNNDGNIVITIGGAS